MLSLRLAYLLSIIGTLGPFYFLFYYFRKNIRQKMRRMSLYGAIAGPLSELWYLKDYWQPTFTLGQLGFIEDMLFGALLAGFSGGLISILFNVDTAATDKFKNKNSRRFIFIGAAVGALLLLTTIFKLNSIYSSVIAFLVITVFIWRERRDLIKYSLAGAGIWVFLAAIGYNIILLFWPTMIRDWWLWQNISRITFLRVPLEEYLWFGSWGLVGSVIFEWKRGYELIARKSS